MRLRHDYLRELRLRFSKTQHEIAEETGVDIRTYRKYETGEISSISDKSLRASQYEFLRNLAACYDLKGGPEELLVPDDAQPEHTHHSPAGLPTSGCFTPVRYVHRPQEEARALRRLERAGFPVVVQAPERFGATRFVGYLLNHPVGLPTTPLTIRLNLARLLSLATSSGKPLLSVLAEHILLKTCRDAGLAEERARLLRSLPTTERGKLSWLLEQYVLPSASRIYFAFEHADAVAGHPGQADFFGVLRSWSEAADTEPWGRLRLLLTISTEPSILEQGEYPSFFTVAAPIRLEEFDREQLLEMGALEGMSHPEAIDKLMMWIGGHPYLAKLAMQAACERDLDVDQLIEKEDVRRSVFAHHLTHLRRIVEGRPGLLDVVARILERSRLRVSLEDSCYLYKKGLTLEEDTGTLKLRCRLYEDYFQSLCGARHLSK